MEITTKESTELTVPTVYQDLITTKYNLLITNLSPTVHSSGTLGNESLLMVERVIDPEDPESVPQNLPCLTGNSLRHSLREALAHMTLRLLNIELNSLPIAAQHFLLSGGSLGKQAASLDIEAYRKILEMFPYVGLFGGGLGSVLLAGKLQVAYAILVCEQNLWRIKLLYPNYANIIDGLRQAEEYRVRNIGTRHDIRRTPISKQISMEKDIAAWQERIVDETKGKEDSTQMIYGYEAVATGARWLWQVGGVLLTPLEHSALLCALLSMAVRGVVGAKSGTGHGKISLRALDEGGESSPLSDGLQSISEDTKVEHAIKTFAAPYTEHVSRHSDEITKWLTEMK